MECSDYKIIKPMHLKCIDSLLTVKVTQFELTKTPYKMLKKGETIDKISEKFWQSYQRNEI